MKKIKLLIFPGNFLPHMGGLETHINEFTKYLSADKKYDITIFSPDVIGAKKYEKIHNNVKIIRYPAFEPVPNFPVPKFWNLDFWNLYLKLYKKDYNIVMSRTRFFINSSLGMFFAKFRLRRKKLIHVEHGSEFVMLSSSFSTFVAKLYDMTFGWLLFKLSDKNISISEASRKFVCKNFINCKKEKLPIIRRGVDFDLYDEKISGKYLKDFDSKIKMVFLGRLFKWKGVENSIDAYKSLPEKIRKKCVLIIVGDGEDYKRLEIKAGKYLNNGIYMFGKRSFSDSIEILKESDIYIHSAYPGGALSNSLLQAMITKCSVVASPNEGADEVVRDMENGILLKDNSAKEIRKGIIKLAENKELRKSLSKKAQNDIKKDFDWKKVIKRYEEIFDEVLEDVRD